MNIINTKHYAPQHLVELLNNETNSLQDVSNSTGISYHTLKNYKYGKNEPSSMTYDLVMSLSTYFLTKENTYEITKPGIYMVANDVYNDLVKKYTPEQRHTSTWLSSMSIASKYTSDGSFKLIVANDYVLRTYDELVNTAIVISEDMYRRLRYEDKYVTYAPVFISGNVTGPFINTSHYETDIDDPAFVRKLVSLFTKARITQYMEAANPLILGYINTIHDMVAASTNPGKFLFDRNIDDFVDYVMPDEADICIRQIREDLKEHYDKDMSYDTYLTTLFDDIFNHKYYIDADIPEELGLGLMYQGMFAGLIHRLKNVNQCKVVGN